MNPASSKKQNILLILNVLKQYSDENHRLSRQRIAELVEQDYGVKIDLKAIKRNLINLIDSGYDIEYTETTRKDKSGEEDPVCTDWYLNCEFDDAELCLLIESLLFSKHIPYSQCKDLIEKLKGLSSKYFAENINYIRAMPENNAENKQLLYTIEVLNEAIFKGKKVSFHYTRFGMDKRRHIVAGRDGEPREYKISPYRMAVANL